jgi:hypothetical protein
LVAIGILPSSELGSWTLRLFETEISCRKLFLLIGWQSLHLLRRQTLMQRDKIEIVLLLLCKGEVLLPLLIFNLLRLQILDLLLTLRTQPLRFRLHGHQGNLRDDVRICLKEILDVVEARARRFLLAIR